MKILSMPATGPQYITTGLTIYNGRCTIDAGGYYLNNGRCYVDITITLTQNRGANEQIINGFPRAASTGTIITMDGCQLIQEGSNPVGLQSASVLSANTTHRIVGSYVIY